MDVKKIKYNHELLKNKIRLEKEMKMVNNELCNQQLNCNHLPVLVGFANRSKLYRNSCPYIKCLLCGKTFSTDYLKSSLNAISYKSSELYGEDQYGILDSRFNMLHEKVLSYLQENQELTEDQLEEKIAAEIAEDKIKHQKLIK